jgi:hypothetical protein
MFPNGTDGLKCGSGQFMNFFVGPIRAVGICLEQNDGTFDLLRCSFGLFDDDFKFLTFLIGKPNDIFFRVRDNPSVRWS